MFYWTTLFTLEYLRAVFPWRLAGHSPVAWGGFAEHLPTLAIQLHSSCCTFEKLQEGLWIIHEGLVSVMWTVMVTAGDGGGCIWSTCQLLACSCLSALKSCCYLWHGEGALGVVFGGRWRSSLLDGVLGLPRFLHYCRHFTRTLSLCCCVCAFKCIFNNKLKRTH